MASRRTLLWTAGVAALGLALSGCASATPAPGSSGKTASGQVTVYSPAASEMDKVIEAFNDEYPDIQINVVRLVGQELATRLQSEVTSGQRVADVLLDSTATAYGPWGDGSTAEWYEPYLPDGYADLPQEDYDEDQGWFVPFSSGFGMAYNSEALSEDEAPADWAELVDPTWKGRFIMSDPRTLGASSITLAELSLAGVIDDAWLEELVALDPQVVDSATAIGQSLVSGAADVALWGGGYLAGMQSQGASVGWNGSSTAQSPTAAALVAGAPNPEAAKVFMAWLLSNKAQAAFAEDGFIPQMPDSPVPGFITAEDRKTAPIMPPYAEFAPEVRRIMELMTEMLG